jgi:hypothetical protein
MPSLPQSDHPNENGGSFDFLLRPLSGLSTGRSRSHDRSRSRTRNRALGALGLGLGLAGSLTALPVAAGAAPASSDSAQTVLQQAVTSMQQSKSSHLVITVNRQGTKSTETIDIGPHGGMAAANEGGRVLHILYTGHTIYLSGKPAVLTSVLGMPSKEAAKYGGKWLSAPTSMGGMSQLAQLFSLSTFAQSLVNLNGPLSKTSQTAANGQAAIKVTGNIPKTTVNQNSGGDQATVLVTASKPRYPISVAFSDTTNGSTHVVFSKWGKTVSVKAPANSVPPSKWAAGSSSQSG